MAGDGHHCHRGVDDWIAKEVQAELGLLAVPLEQRSLDYLGSRRWRVRTDCSSIRVGGPEHPRCNKEQTRIRELIATGCALHSFLPADSVTLLTAITRDYISIANPALNSSARPHCGIPPAVTGRAGNNFSCRRRRNLDGKKERYSLTNSTCDTRWRSQNLRAFGYDGSRTKAATG